MWPLPGEPVPQAARPQRPPLAVPFFYGWVIVACVSTAGFLASGMTNVVMSVMLKPIAEEMGWTRTMIATALGLGALLGGVVSPPVGWLADRYGPRALIALGGATSGVLYLALAQVHVFSLFFLTYVANRLVTIATMAGIVGQTAVANWFFFRRPRVLGIVGMVGALGGSVMAVVAQFLLEYSTWRAVMVTYGVLVLLLVVGPSALLLRRRPEDLGMAPDGLALKPGAPAAVQWSKRGGASAAAEYPWTLGQAIRTPALWLIIASLGLASYGITSVSTHQVAYYTDQGIAPVVAAGVLVAYTFSSAMSSLIWGFLTEQFDERMMNVTALLLAALWVWILTTVDNPVSAFIFGVGFGLFARGENTLIHIVLARYFGRGSFGTITGFTLPFQTASGALGPILTGLTFDLTQSYLGAFYALIAVFLCAAWLMFLARRPIPPLPR